MKSYDEIANNIFKRRDEHIAKQKRKKRIIINTVTPILGCYIVLITSFGLWKSGFFSNNTPISESSQNVSDNSDNDFFEDDNSSVPPNDTSSKDSSLNSSSNDSHSSDSNLSSKPITNNGDSSQAGVVPDNTPSNPTDNTTSNSSPSTPPVTEMNYYIDSIDKINFYSAKKIISEKSLLPIGMSANLVYPPKILLLNNNYSEYSIDRNKVFTSTMVTYFTIKLNNEKGFLAQKLGGTGLVEIVVTENNIEDMGQMITFKREDKYYTCFMNGQSNDINSGRVSREFSSHKYIDGFNIIKNLEQENYKFTVHYDGSKVVGFECAPFHSVPTNYVVDDVTFIEDFCVVIYAKQTFTIDELEIYFKNEGETL